MSEQETLEKAIEKANAAGFIKFGYERPELEWFNEDEKTFAITWHDPFESDNLKQSYHSLFDHEFAKALWGEEEREPEFNLVTKQGWKGYLQQMVIAENPIKYLGDHYADN